MVKDFQAEYYFNYLISPLKFLIGIFLVLKGSANFLITLALLCMLASHLIMYQTAIHIKYIDVTSFDFGLYLKIKQYAIVLVGGYLLGLFIFLHLRRQQRVLKYLARLSNCLASITICHFILGPMPI